MSRLLQYNINRSRELLGWREGVEYACAKMTNHELGRGNKPECSKGLE